MRDKLKYAWHLLRAKDYMIVTEKVAASYLPNIDPYDLDNILLVHAQRVTLDNIREKLNQVIKAHDKRIKQLTKGR